MAERKSSLRIEPAHRILYEPASLAQVEAIPDTDSLLQTVALSLKNPFNDRQREAFALSFAERILLLWGPPGTGKTTVLAGIILGWLERARSTGRPVYWHWCEQLQCDRQCACRSNRVD
jgi:ATP-dependent exoDNAse (exonuclease V) alpha subunit